jgi:hypothetical protein
MVGFNFIWSFVPEAMTIKITLTKMKMSSVLV